MVVLDQELRLQYRRRVDDQLRFGGSRHEPSRLPAGTAVEAVAHFDNSAFNSYNPDANKSVRYGVQTFDEMSNGFVLTCDGLHDRWMVRLTAIGSTTRFSFVLDLP